MPYQYTELDTLLESDVMFANDALEGLILIDRLMSNNRGDSPEEDAAEEEKKAERKARRERSQRVAAKRREAEGELPDLYDTTRSAVDANSPVPEPPFWGSRVIKGISSADYAALLDERATF